MNGVERKNIGLYEMDHSVVARASRKCFASRKSVGRTKRARPPRTAHRIHPEEEEVSAAGMRISEEDEADATE